MGWERHKENKLHTFHDRETRSHVQRDTVELCWLPACAGEDPGGGEAVRGPHCASLHISVCLPACLSVCLPACVCPGLQIPLLSSVQA